MRPEKKIFDGVSSSDSSVVCLTASPISILFKYRIYLMGGEGGLCDTCDFVFPVVFEDVL